MVTYATTEDVAQGFRDLTTSELDVCAALLEEAAVVIDTYAKNANEERKKVVSCRMVRRALASTSQSVPMGATQGTMTAGPYSQSWTLGSGSSTGELYLSKVDKQMLGVGDRIGSRSPIEYGPPCCGHRKCDEHGWN